MKWISALLVLFSAAAFADTGDVEYLHFGVLERTAVEAAAENPDAWRDLAAGFENPSIAMTAEEVNITLRGEYAEIEAIFDFENTSAQTNDVEMCFPVSFGMIGETGYATRDEDFTFAGRRADLTVTVDGEETSYELEDAEEGLDFGGLAHWPVHFGAGAKRRVVCRYKDDYNGGGGRMRALSFVYILYTGATWKGPIGRGVINVRPGADFDWSLPVYYLAAGIPPARDEDDRIVWEFENLEPPFWADPNGLPKSSSYYEVETKLSGAGIEVGFPTAATMAKTYPSEGEEVPEGEGAAALVLVDGLNFRTAPDAGAPRVAGKEKLALGEGLALLERQGEWYRVRAIGGAEGWVRWRYVDPATDEENIYVEIMVAYGGA